MRKRVGSSPTFVNLLFLFHFWRSCRFGFCPGSPCTLDQTRLHIRANGITGRAGEGRICAEIKAEGVNSDRGMMERPMSSKPRLVMLPWPGAAAGVNCIHSEQYLSIRSRSYMGSELAEPQTRLEHLQPPSFV